MLLITRFLSVVLYDESYFGSGVKVYTDLMGVVML